MTDKMNQSDMSKNRQRIASDNQRALSAINQLMGHVDEVLDAAQEDAWSDVQDMSKDLVSESIDAGCLDVADCASRLYESVTIRTDKQDMKKRVIKLVGAIGRAKVMK